MVRCFISCAPSFTPPLYNTFVYVQVDPIQGTRVIGEVRCRVLEQQSSQANEMLELQVFLQRYGE